MTIPPAKCAGLVPVEWSQGVKPVTLPDTGADALDAARAWAAAFVAQTGQLEKANGRTADTIAIMQRCEDMVNAARPDAATLKR